MREHHSYYESKEIVVAPTMIDRIQILGAWGPGAPRISRQAEWWFNFFALHIRTIVVPIVVPMVVVRVPVLFVPIVVVGASTVLVVVGW